MLTRRGLFGMLAGCAVAPAVAMASPKPAIPPMYFLGNDGIWACGGSAEPFFVSQTVWTLPGKLISKPVDGRRKMHKALYGVTAD